MTAGWGHWVTPASAVEMVLRRKNCRAGKAENATCLGEGQDVPTEQGLAHLFLCLITMHELVDAAGIREPAMEIRTNSLYVCF